VHVHPDDDPWLAVDPHERGRRLDLDVGIRAGAARLGFGARVDARTGENVAVRTVEHVERPAAAEEHDALPVDLRDRGRGDEPDVDVVPVVRLERPADGAGLGVDGIKRFVVRADVDRAVGDGRRGGDRRSGPHDPLREHRCEGHRSDRGAFLGLGERVAGVVPVLLPDARRRGLDPERGHGDEEDGGEDQDAAHEGDFGVRWGGTCWV
jgi:hypothetical protein